MCATRPASRPRDYGCRTRGSRLTAAGADPMTAAIREAIRSQALAMGFDAVGFAAATLAEAARSDLAEYIGRGYHGDMGWLAHTVERRGDPRALWPEARSVVVFGLNYWGEHAPCAEPAPRTGTISG